MIYTSSSADIERFRSAVARCLGLHFEDAKLGFLADTLRRRLDALGQPPDLYLARLETENLPDEVGALAQELTVPETYFFRNSDQYRALAEIALPDRTTAQSGARRLRILSAGCASGEEAYSLAIVIRETVDPSWDVSILGVDVNPAMVRKATRARYSPWALRETPAQVQQRCFRPDGREFLLDEALRTAVRFEARNLVQDAPHLWLPDTYDIVFFRNVLMYFTHENAQAAVARIARALKTGGYLFLGHAETLRGLSNDFHLHHTHETFYYQRKDRLESSARPSTASASSRGLFPSVVAAVESADSWIDAIHRATSRIEALTGSARPSASPPPGSLRPSAAPVWDLDRALELLREERFTEALETMQRLPPESGRDPDVLLLSAALHTHRGRLTEAEEACKRLLDVDELSAGAHYLLALCREGARDKASAMYYDQAAIYLDPSFAMPHLHLGLLARRAGDRAMAQRELGQALLLLQREDGSRLLMFGGGFSRETLIALCRTELVGCGGRS
jgi:chemotaxis protein methyltransferase CheR